MSANTLMKIVREAKRERRAHPSKHKGKNAWRHFMSDAAKKVKKKTATPKRKKAAVKKKARKQRRSRRKGVAVRSPQVRAVRVARVKRRKRHSHWGTVKQHRRRVSGVGKMDMGTIALVAGAAIVGIALLSKKSAPQNPQYPPLISSGNLQTDTKAQQVVAYAQSAGLALDAITRLINAINSNPAHADRIYDSIQQGGGIPSNYV